MTHCPTQKKPSSRSWRKPSPSSPTPRRITSWDSPRAWRQPTRPSKTRRSLLTNKAKSWPYPPAGDTPKHLLTWLSSIPFPQLRLVDKSRGQYADIAQTVERLICNQQVAGSNPVVGSRHPERLFRLPLWRKQRFSPSRSWRVKLDREGESGRLSGRRLPLRRGRCNSGPFHQLRKEHHTTHPLSDGGGCVYLVS